MGEPERYRPRQRDHRFVVAADVGGTKTLLALINKEGRVLGATVDSTVVGEQETVPVLVADVIQQFLEKSGIDPRQVIGVGVGIPGLIDRTTRRVLSCPNLPSWEGLDLEGTLGDALCLPVRIENDVNLASLGEHWVGAGQGTSNLACVLVGTGIGCGLILNDRLHIGWQGIAGELGHTTVVHDGEECTCGNRGCLETVASGWGIAQMARRSVERGHLRSVLEAAEGSPNQIRAEHVFEAARGGDPDARAIVDIASRYLGLSIANLINLIDPETIILGGGVVDGGGSEFLSAIANIATSRCRSVSSRRCQVRLGELAPNAGVVGCGKLFWV